jgi:hypothetical protein
MVHFDPALKFVCPVCEAPWGESCHVQVGTVRFESHHERMSLANEELFDSIAEGNAVEFINEQAAAGKWKSS